MEEIFGDGLVGEKPSAEIKALVSSRITSGESVLWAGRPGPGILVLRSLPKALAGLGFVAFTLVWMTGVIRGGNNNWDRGRPVPPFAPHNVLIATCAGLWLLPFGLYMLTGPLRAWRKGGGTAYALTDRREVVIEPGLLGGFTNRSYTPGDLALMRCDERADGTGDLVFEGRKTWVGTPQAVGFLAVDRVRGVEALVRKTLLTGKAGHGSPGGPPEGPAAGGRTYRVSVGFRFFRGVALAVGVISSLCLVGNLVVALAALVIMPKMALALPASVAVENGWPGPLGVAGGIAIALATLTVGGLVAWNAFRFALATPTEVVITGAGAVELRSWLRTTVLQAGDIASIKTGGWIDPNGFHAVIRHKGGKVVLVNQFPEFRDLLATIKAVNPAVEIRGF